MQQQEQLPVPGNTAGCLDIRIVGFKPFAKNTLAGFLDVEIAEIGLTIRGCALHRTEQARWIGLPAREYATPEGRSWTPICEIADKRDRDRFQLSVLAAYDEYAAANGGAR